MVVERISKELWQSMSRDAHKVVFSELRDPELERIDYALLVLSDSATPMGYITCQERDSETIYWQFGGTFPGTKDTIGSFRTMTALLSHCRANYKRVSFLVENKNIPMLKMAMKVGFTIVGIRNFKGAILLEHLLEFEEGK